MSRLSWRPPTPPHHPHHPWGKEKAIPEQVKVVTDESGGGVQTKTSGGFVLPPFSQRKWSSELTWIPWMLFSHGVGDQLTQCRHCRRLLPSARILFTAVDLQFLSHNPH